MSEFSKQIAEFRDACKMYALLNKKLKIEMKLAKQENKIVNYFKECMHKDYKQEYSKCGYKQLREEVLDIKRKYENA